jgi:prevent-host-death family protein
MVKNPNKIPVTELKQHPSATLKRVRKAKRPLIVTQHGKPAAVLLGVSAYEKGEREREILKLLALGEREMAVGKGHDLEDVLAEADELLFNM